MFNFLKKVFGTKYDKDVKEEKKIIYNKSYKDTNDKLSVLFSKEEIKTVNALLKKQNQKKK